MFTLKHLNTDCSPAHIFTQKARTHTKFHAAASPY